MCRETTTQATVNVYIKRPGLLQEERRGARLQPLQKDRLWEHRHQRARRRRHSGGRGAVAFLPAIKARARKGASGTRREQVKDPKYGLVEALAAEDAAAYVADVAEAVEEEANRTEARAEV